ncbi:hypothetical protein ABH927_000410 [Planotetraspora sp. GP83]
MPISLSAEGPVMSRPPVGAATHCPYCALQCGMFIADGEVTPRTDIPANAGGLCQKGWTAAELLGSPERLTSPLLRGSPVSWDEALDFVVGRIRAIRAEHGPDGVAVFGGGGLTNEKAYQLGKFARVALRTSQIDYNGRFRMSSAAVAANRAFGMDRGLPFPITDIGAAGAVLFAGGNVAETMPPFVRHLTAMRANGGRLVVVDPRVTRTAKLADLHLRVTPGTDLALALGLPGRPGSGYGCVTGQGNGQGGREHGQKADQLPGYRKIDDPAARAHVAAVWGVSPADLARTRPVGLRAPRRAGHPARAEGAAAVRVESGDLRAGRHPGRGAAGRAGPPGGVRLRALRDRRDGGRRAPHDPVGRGRGHDDQSGGPRPAPAAGRVSASRGAERPVHFVRHRRPARLRREVPHGPPRGLRGTAPGLGRRDRRQLRDHLREDRGRNRRLLALPRGGARGGAAPGDAAAPSISFETERDQIKPVLIPLEVVTG